jgi:hypothetical protein
MAPTNPETAIVDGYGLEIPFGDVRPARSAIVIDAGFEKTISGGAELVLTRDGYLNPYASETAGSWIRTSVRIRIKLIEVRHKWATFVFIASSDRIWGLSNRWCDVSQRTRVHARINC